MNSFEFNKIAASVLVALLVAMTGSLLSEYLAHPHKIEKNVLDIALETPGSTADSGPKVLQPIEPLLASASIENGKVAAKKCVQCHTFEEGGANRTGPNLWGVVGGKIAHAADFAYSAVFKEKQGSWNYEELNKFLYKPREYAPGTKMSFVGIKDDKERADLIAYLRSLSKNPEPLPAS
jgi:cytochrome c